MLTTYLQYVTDNLDSIDDADPELAPAGDDGAKYENAVLLTTDEAQPVSTGAFEMKAMDFGGFKNPWIAKLPADAEITDDDAFVIEVEAQNIGLLYAKLTSNAGKADVYVDDELVATIDADFTGGWGNYVQMCIRDSSGSESSGTVLFIRADFATFSDLCSAVIISQAFRWFSSLNSALFIIAVKQSAAISSASSGISMIPSAIRYTV